MISLGLMKKIIIDFAATSQRFIRKSWFSLTRKAAVHRCSIKKVLWEISQNSYERLATLLKNEIHKHVFFFVNFCEIFLTSCFEEHLHAQLILTYLIMKKLLLTCLVMKKKNHNQDALHDFVREMKAG